MNPKLPQKQAGILEKEIGNETFLYSTDDRTVHVLNPAARLIWDLCTGEHTVEEMEQSIRRRFAVPPERDVLADIESTLAAFAQKGLLQ